jgi:hypothetical protein
MAKKVTEKILAAADQKVAVSRSKKTATTKRKVVKKINNEIEKATATAEANWQRIINEESPTKKKFVAPQFFHSHVFKIAVMFFAVIVLFFAVDIYGLYNFGWQDLVSYDVAQIFNLPAGKVNNSTIKLTDYIDNVKILKVAVSENREGIDTSILNNKESLNNQIFSLLAANLLVSQELNRYQKEVTAADLNAQMKIIIAQMGDEKTTATNIAQLYNLNLNQFQTKILKPLMEKELLQQLITADTSLEINQQAKKKADSVLQLALQPNVDFKILANQYTEDESGINIGGDMGWISSTDADTEDVDVNLKTILFSLATNTVYNQVILNKTGYHIVKVEEKREDSATNKQSVEARQILIKVNVDEYIRSLMNQVKIKKYVQA